MYILAPGINNPGLPGWDNLGFITPGSQDGAERRAPYRSGRLSAVRILKPTVAGDYQSPELPP